MTSSVAPQNLMNLTNSLSSSQIQSNRDILQHHGILGQKWGIRRYQNKDGTLTSEGKSHYRETNDFTLKKGSEIKRVSTSRSDPTYDNKKYVSINDEDHSKWEDYLGKGYLDYGEETFNQTYSATKRLKIMSSTNQGKLFTEMMLDTDFKNQALKDISYSDSELGVKSSNSAAENISRNIAIQTKTGEEFLKKVMSENYDGLVDTHGTNVSKIPVIILNPDQNLTKSKDPTYTKATQDYYDNYFQNMFGF